MHFLEVTIFDGMIRKFFDLFFSIMKLHSFIILIEFSTAEIDEPLITDVIKNSYKFILFPVL